MTGERITARFEVETRYPLAQAAAALAGEQSSGTFLPVPGETPELLARFGATVEGITDLGEREAAALPGSRAPNSGGFARPRRAFFDISWSVENTGFDLPTVWATVAGNCFELHHFSAIRLVDVGFPTAFAQAYLGPGFGVEGTRHLTGVRGRPVIGTIVKPSVGLSPAETAALADDLLWSGIDFIKDDELMGDPPHSPFADRLAAVMPVIERHADRTGHRALFAANISGDYDGMMRRLDLVNRRGNCAMIVLNAVGLPAAAAVRRRAAVPIHGHRAGWGLYSRSPDIGLSYAAFGKFWRLAGVDHLHVNGLRNKFCEPDASVIASARACLTPLFELPGRPDTVMPVFSSGQSAVQVEDTFRALGTTDLIFCCGGGIMAHPGGPKAGVESLHQAWAAAVAGIPAREAAASQPALAAALDRFG